MMTESYGEPDCQIWQLGYFRYVGENDHRIHSRLPDVVVLMNEMRLELNNEK